MGARVRVRVEVICDALCLYIDCVLNMLCTLHIHHAYILASLLTCHPTHLPRGEGLGARGWGGGRVGDIIHTLNLNSWELGVGSGKTEGVGRTPRANIILQRVRSRGGLSAEGW